MNEHKGYTNDYRLTQELYREIEMLKKTESLNHQITKTPVFLEDDVIKEKVPVVEVIENKDFDIISNKELIQKQLQSDDQRHKNQIFTEYKFFYDDEYNKNTNQGDDKIREEAERRYSEVLKGLAENPRLLSIDSLSIAKEIALNDNLISVPKSQIIMLSELMFNIIVDKNTIIEPENNHLLYSILNPRYRSGKKDVDINNKVKEDFNVNIIIHGHTKTIKVSSYTGFVNGTTEKLENFYNILKILFNSREVDLSEMDTAVKRFRSDDLSRTFLVSYVKMKINNFNFSTECRDFLLASFDKMLKDMNIPVIKRRDVALRTEAMIMYDKVNTMLKENSRIDQANKLLDNDFDLGNPRTRK